MQFSVFSQAKYIFSHPTNFANIE